MTLLAVENLHTHFISRSLDNEIRVAKALNGVSFALERGRVLGLVGETGAGKSLTALSIMGLLKPPYQFSLIMGVLGGIPGTTKNLVHQVDSLPPGSFWQVIGIGLNQWPLVAAALSMGGNIRVGLEDNLYISAGELARSNGDLVAKAAALVRVVGGDVASVAEAREILQLPRKSHAPHPVSDQPA